MADPDRGALMLVRVIAVALLGIGAVNVLLYAVDCSVHHVSMQPLSVVLRGAAALLGVVCLIRSKSLAAWLSDWLDL